MFDRLPHSPCCSRNCPGCSKESEPSLKSILTYNYFFISLVINLRVVVLSCFFSRERNSVSDSINKKIAVTNSCCSLHGSRSLVPQSAGFNFPGQQGSNFVSPVVFAWVPKTTSRLWFAEWTSRSQTPPNCDCLRRNERPLAALLQPLKSYVLFFWNEIFLKTEGHYLVGYNQVFSIVRKSNIRVFLSENKTSYGQFQRFNDEVLAYFQMKCSCDQAGKFTHENELWQSFWSFLLKSRKHTLPCAPKWVEFRVTRKTKKRQRTEFWSDMFFLANLCRWSKTPSNLSELFGFQLPQTSFETVNEHVWFVEVHNLGVLSR